MRSYRKPGVFFEWRERAEPPPGLGARLDVAGFVGIAARGPINEPVRLRDYEDFEAIFGGRLPQGYLAYAVEGFFANGGLEAWVVRVADEDLARPAWINVMSPLPRELLAAWRGDDTEGTADDSPGRATLDFHVATLRASSPGAWGNQVNVRLILRGAYRFDLDVSTPDDAFESWRSLSLMPWRGDPREAEEHLARNFFLSVLQDSILLNAAPTAALVAFWLRELDACGPDANARLDRILTALDVDLSARIEELADAMAAAPKAIGVAEPADSLAGLIRKTGKTPDGEPSLRAESAEEPPASATWTAMLPAVSLSSIEGVGIAESRIDPRVPAAVQAAMGRAFQTGDVVDTAARRVSGNLRFGFDGLAPEARVSCFDPAVGYVRIVGFDPNRNYDKAEIAVPDGVGPGPFTLEIRFDDEPERFEGLSLHHDSPDFIDRRVNDPATGSRLIYAQFVPGLDTGAVRGARMRPGLTLTHIFGSEDPTLTRDAAAAAQCKMGLALFDDALDVGLLCMPDLMPKTADVFRPAAEPCAAPSADRAVKNAPDRPPAFAPNLSNEQIQTGQVALLQHCMARRYCFALLDPPPPLLERPRSADGRLLANDADALRGRTAVATILDWRRRLESRASAFGALYFPWVMVVSPETRDRAPKWIPPSGHVAGMFARVEVGQGIGKPPANEVLQGVGDVAVALDDVVFGDLNTNGINVIHAAHERGIRVTGARTLSVQRDWRYINLRRTVMMVEKTLERDAQWTVFEPDTPALWSDLDRIIRSFLDRLWRAGQLAGATAEDAYFVRCDETTNPPEQVDRGLATCLIGLRLPLPAEFIILRIGRTESGALVET